MPEDVRILPDFVDITIGIHDIMARYASRGECFEHALDAPLFCCRMVHDNIIARVNSCGFVVCREVLYYFHREKGYKYRFGFFPSLLRFGTRLKGFAVFGSDVRLVNGIKISNRYKIHFKGVPAFQILLAW